MPRTLTGAVAYVDRQDTDNEGWAYRLTFDDNHQESDALDADGTESARRALVLLVASFLAGDDEDDGPAFARARAGMARLEHDGGGWQWAAGGGK